MADGDARPILGRKKILGNDILKNHDKSSYREYEGGVSDGPNFPDTRSKIDIHFEKFSLDISLVLLQRFYD